MARAAAGRFGWLYGGGLRGGGLSGGGPRADGLLRCRLLRRSLLALRRLALVLEAAAGARAVWLGLGLGEALAVLLLRFFLEAERLAQAPGIDLLQRPFRQLAESEGAIGDANKAVHREAEMAADLAHLPVLAFVQGHGEPGIGAGLVVERGLDRAIVDALDGDTLGERRQALRHHAAVHAHAVAAQPAARRQLQLALQGAVVGQQQQAFRIDVEPADRLQAAQFGRQAIEYRGAAVGVARGGDIPAWLVVAEEARRGGGRQGFAIDFDARLGGDRGGGAGQHAAVDGDPAGGDPGLGVAPRAEPGAGDDLGDDRKSVV